MKRFNRHLPKLHEFVFEQAHLFQRNDLTEEQLNTNIIHFFEDKIQYYDDILPGWGFMSSFSDYKTMVHTIKTIIALLSLDEYQDLSNTNWKNLLLWITLLHDIGKDLTNHRDPLHPFKSAVVISQNADKLKFNIKSSYEDIIEEWSKLTFDAYTTINGKLVHDFSKIYDIVSGIDKLFKRQSNENYLVKVVLLHQGINAEKDWPRDVVLNEDQIRFVFDNKLLYLLEFLMLADSWAWNLFNDELWNRYKGEIKENVHLVREIINE